MSHHQQIREQTQPMEVKEAPGVPPPSPHFKKRHFGVFIIPKNGSFQT